jgi:hypothetical protein
MIDYIDISLHANHVINSIEFNNLFFIKYFVNYMIKIYCHKIEHQLKIKKLFGTVITLKINK